MNTFQNPKHGDKWLCEKCHTWCVNQVPRCSWCGTKRSTPPAPPAPKVTPKKEDEEKQA